MDVQVVIDKSLDNNKIILNSNDKNQYIDKIRDYAEKVDLKIVGKNQDKTALISSDDIFYIESIEKKTFIYLKDELWECKLRLYEIEERLNRKVFIRISKSSIVNINYVKKISLMINRNLMLKMDNKEKIIVSRRYVKTFKEFLKMEG